MGTTLAAYAVEVVAQKNVPFATDFNDLVRRHIHAPLGGDVNNMSYHSSDLQHSNTPLAPPNKIFVSLSEDNGVGFAKCEQYSAIDWPGSDWRTSAGNYARFLAMYINDGTYKDAQLLKPASVQWMKKKYGAPSSEKGYQISNANFIYVPGDNFGIENEVLGHGGLEVGVATMAFFNPATNIGVIVFTNTGNCVQ